jgi:hypothetical protein
MGAGKPVTGIEKEVIVQHTTEIPREGWDKFFNRFSEEHDTQFVAVEVMGPDIGAQVEGRSLLLSGISSADNHNESLALTFDSLNGEHLTHMVNKPIHIWVQRAPDNTDEALEIEAADGTRTLVRFASSERSSQSDDLKGAERFPRKSDDEV